MSKKYHQSIPLHLVKRWVEAYERRGQSQSVLFRGECPLTNKEARAEIERLEGEEYTICPPCDHVDGKGNCLGHTIEKE